MKREQVSQLKELIDKYISFLVNIVVGIVRISEMKTIITKEKLRNNEKSDMTMTKGL